MPQSFTAFFETATGNQPYDWQARLAGGDARVPCESRLISIPTGLGKTAGVVLAWLWNRAIDPHSEIHNPQSEWPRRLVFFETLLRAADARASANQTTPH